MRKQRKIKIGLSVFVLFLFAIWTYLLTVIDVRSIGACDTNVGFASLNCCFHNMTGVDFYLYAVTDILGLVPIMICVFFAFVGFIQLVKRKRLFLVDHDILLLGTFYIFVIFFPVFIITKTHYVYYSFFIIIIDIWNQTNHK